MNPTRFCSIDGCDRPIRSRGWCTSHYNRWRRHGDPMGGRQRYSSPEESFKARAAWRGGCLIWTGSLNTPGYGQISVSGRVVLTHRYAWEKENGAIPAGLFLDHICREPACCNINHLRLVTNKQNTEHAGLSARNSSGHRGVHWSKRDRKWVATVNHNGTSFYLGSFSDVNSAGGAALAFRNSVYTHNDMDRRRNSDEAQPPSPTLKAI